MTDSTEVSTTSTSVPALANTPALEISAEDVALPRIYLGQHMSEHVQESRVPYGSIFTALGSDDPDPEVLYENGDDAGVIVHVLAMRKGKSYSDGGDLELFAFNDPAAPPEAWTTYNYVVTLPEQDPEVPYKWLLTKTGTPAARQINLILSKYAARGPAYSFAFEAKTAKRENDKGKFVVPQVAQVEAKPENVAIAESLLVMVSGDSAEVAATGEEPAI